MEPTTASKQFIDRLTIEAAPRWLNLQQLSEHLDKVNQLWCVIHNNGRVVPIDVQVIEAIDVYKGSELTDININCCAISSQGHTGDPFIMKASIFVPKTKRASDVVKFNYQHFGSFSRAFVDETARDDYLDELGWLDEILTEVAQEAHTRQIKHFFKHFGGQR